MLSRRLTELGQTFMTLKIGQNSDRDLGHLFSCWFTDDEVSGAGEKTPRVKGASDWTRFLIQVLAHRDEPVPWGRSLAPSQETRIMALLPSILCWKQIFVGRAFKLLIQMQGRGTADVLGAADLEETRTRSPSSHSSQPVSFHYHRPGLLPHA